MTHEQITEHQHIAEHQFPWAAGVEVVHLTTGFSSHVYRAGAHIVKVTKFSGMSDEAFDLASTLRWEHELYEDELRGFTPPTLIGVANCLDTADEAQVFTLQPFMPGVPVGEYLPRPNAYTGEIITFLRASLRMYRKWGIIPDIAHVQHGFRFSRTTNVIVDLATHHPTLVDTNRGRTQRKQYIGDALSVGIAAGAKAALIRLKREYDINYPASW